MVEVAHRVLTRPMRGHEANELAGCEYLCLLPEFRKMPLVPDNEVVRAGDIGAFDEHIVVRVAGYFKAADG